MKILHPENIDFNHIRNILFDWGGVITNINYHKTVAAFEKLGISNFNEFYTQLHQTDLFINYEIGAITSDKLRRELRKACSNGVENKQIDEAWCAMLLDTPRQNIEIIKNLSTHFRVFLLSNTNDIHVNYYNQKLKETHNIDYPALFEKVYYSHAIGFRKPNKDIFEYVLKTSNLIPSETLFIDDTEMHADTAASLGINSLYLKPGFTIENVYSQWIV
jgi:glucose-1-phosphatase